MAGVVLAAATAAHRDVRFVRPKAVAVGETTVPGRKAAERAVMAAALQAVLEVPDLAEAVILRVGSALPAGRNERISVKSSITNAENASIAAKKDGHFRRPGMNVRRNCKGLV